MSGELTVKVLFRLQYLLWERHVGRKEDSPNEEHNVEFRIEHPRDSRTAIRARRSARYSAHTQRDEPMPAQSLSWPALARDRYVEVDERTASLSFRLRDSRVSRHSILTCGQCFEAQCPYVHRLPTLKHTHMASPLSPQQGPHQAPLCATAFRTDCPPAQPRGGSKDR